MFRSRILNDDIRLYVPEGFRPEEYLPEELHPYADCARYFLHRIIYGVIFGRLDRRHGYTRLKKDYMKPFFAGHYHEIRTALVTSGAVEVETGDDGKESYSIGHMAKGYRLGPALLDRKWVLCTPAYRPLRKAIFKWRQEDPTRKRMSRPYRHVVEWYKQTKIDASRAKSMIDQFESPEDCKLSECEYREMLVKQVEAIDQGHHNYTICRYGRLHHDVSNLKSDLRCCLSYQDSPLVNLDIRNSQPLFLCLLMLICQANSGCLEHLCSYRPRKKSAPDVNFFSNEEVIEFFDSIEVVRDAREEQREREPGETQAHYVAGIDLIVKKYKTLGLEKTFFLRQCESGTLYDSFTTETMSRDKAKRRFFSEVIYAENHVMRQSTMGKMFRERFPEVYGFMAKIKRKDFAHLSRLMQRYEAAFMFERVVGRLMEEHPDIYVVTIHDSILTPPRHVETVEAIILDEFEQLGLRPSVRVESYAKEAPGSLKRAA